MNILFFAPNTLIDGNKGDSIHLKEVIINLSKSNNIILLARTNNNFCSIENINFKRVRCIIMPRLEIISGSLHSFIMGLNIVLRSKIDVIYERSHTFGSGVIIGKITGIPVIVEVNGLTSEESSICGTYGKVIQKIVYFLEKSYFSGANKLVVVTPRLKYVLQNEYKIQPNKIRVIQNGANINLFKPMDQEIAKAELGLIQQYKYVCFVGNLVPWQGIEYLVEAAPFVIKTAPETIFLIVGDGMMYGPLQSLVKKYHLENHFYFTGSIAYDQVPKYINASDICVAPFILARNEKIGLSPLKIYEYMACGKPVIGSNINGVGDILEKSKSGISFAAENAVEFSKALIRLIKDHQIREKMGRNGRIYVLKNHSWESITLKLISLCKEIT